MAIICKLQYGHLPVSPTSNEDIFLQDFLVIPKGTRLNFLEISIKCFLCYYTHGVSNLQPHTGV